MQSIRRPGADLVVTHRPRPVVWRALLREHSSGFTDKGLAAAWAALAGLVPAQGTTGPLGRTRSSPAIAQNVILPNEPILE